MQIRTSAFPPSAASDPPAAWPTLLPFRSLAYNRQPSSRFKVNRKVFIASDAPKLPAMWRLRMHRSAGARGRHRRASARAFAIQQARALPLKPKAQKISDPNSAAPCTLTQAEEGFGAAPRLKPPGTGARCQFCQGLQRHTARKGEPKKRRSVALPDAHGFAISSCALGRQGSPARGGKKGRGGGAVQAPQLPTAEPCPDGICISPLPWRTGCGYPQLTCHSKTAPCDPATGNTAFSIVPALTAASPGRRPLRITPGASTSSTITLV